MDKSQKEKYERFSLSYDTRDPYSLASAAGIERIVMQTIRSLQNEGEPILRTKRTNIDGISSMDIYTRQGDYAKIKARFDAEMAALMEKAERDIKINLSSASTTMMKTQQYRILNEKERAGISLQAQNAGGFAVTDKSGMTTIKIDTGRTFSEGGVEKNVARSIGGKIINSNTRYTAGIEKMADEAGFVGYKALGRSTDELNTIKRESQARIRAKQKRDEAQKSEEQLIRDRLDRRARVEKYTKEYLKANPNHPMAVSKRKSRRSAQARMAKRIATTAIAYIVAGVAVIVKTLGSILGAVVDLRDTYRARGMVSMFNNFDTNLTTAWESYAAGKGIDKNVFYNAAGTMMSKFGDPTFLRASTFSAIAPMLRGRTGELTAMAQEGGAENVLALLQTLADATLQYSRAGHSPSGDTTPGTALGRNISAIGQALGSDVQQYLQNYLYEMYSTGGTMSLRDWMMQSGKSGATKADPGLQAQSDENRKALEQTGDLWLETLRDVKSILDAIYGFFAHDISSFIGKLETWFAVLLSKLKITDVPLAEVNMKNSAINAASARLVAANLLTEEPAAKAIMDRYGIVMGKDSTMEDVIKTVEQGYSVGGVRIPKASIIPLRANDDAMYMLSQYAESLKTKKDLEADLKKDVHYPYRYNAVDHANASSSRILRSASWYGEGMPNVFYDPLSPIYDKDNEKSLRDAYLQSLIGAIPKDDPAFYNKSQLYTQAVNGAPNTDIEKTLANVGYDLLKANSGRLKGADLTAFVSRMVQAERSKVSGIQFNVGVSTGNILDKSILEKSILSGEMPAALATQANEVFPDLAEFLNQIGATASLQYSVVGGKDSNKSITLTVDYLMNGKKVGSMTKNIANISDLQASVKIDASRDTFQQSFMSVLGKDQ